MVTRHAPHTHLLAPGLVARVRALACAARRVKHGRTSISQTRMQERHGNARAGRQCTCARTRERHARAVSRVTHPSAPCARAAPASPSPCATPPARNSNVVCNPQEMRLQRRTCMADDHTSWFSHKGAPQTRPHNCSQQRAASATDARPPERGGAGLAREPLGLRVLPRRVLHERRLQARDAQIRGTCICVQKNTHQFQL